MQADFSIQVDAARSTVRITMSGFFLASDIGRLQKARDDAHRLLRCAANAHQTLVDIRGMKIQARESVDAFARLLGDGVHASRRLAFVVPSGLARAQICRAASGRGAAFFRSLDEAEAWLDEEPAMTPPPSRVPQSPSV